MFPLSSSVNESKYPFHAGFIVSFLASLPPGIVNILTIQLAITENYIAASWFAAGALAAEIICAKFSLMLMNRAIGIDFIIRILRWLVLIILIALSITSFLASVRGTVGDASSPIRNDLPPFIFGFLTMAVNPGVIPFWLGATAMLFERKILKANNGTDISYLAGIGLGSVIASTVFIACGHFLFSTFIIREQILHFIFGCVFSIMTLMYARKLSGLNSKGAKDI